MVADVPNPTLGADFNLAPHLRASRLVDHTARLSVSCKQKPLSCGSYLLFLTPYLKNAPILSAFSPFSSLSPFLPLEKSKVARAEFEHMMQLDIIRRS